VLAAIAATSLDAVGLSDAGCHFTKATVGWFESAIRVTARNKFDVGTGGDEQH
jgi:hypothetical protein